MYRPRLDVESVLIPIIYCITMIFTNVQPYLLYVYGVSRSIDWSVLQRYHLIVLEFQDWNEKELKAFLSSNSFYSSSFVFYVFSGQIHRNFRGSYFVDQ